MQSRWTLTNFASQVLEEEQHSSSMSDVIAVTYTLEEKGRVEIKETPEENKERMEALENCTFEKIIKGLEGREIDAACKPVIEKHFKRFPDKLPRCLAPDRGARNSTIDIIPGAKLPQKGVSGCKTKKKEKIWKKKSKTF